MLVLSVVENVGKKNPPIGKSKQQVGPPCYATMPLRRVYCNVKTSQNARSMGSHIVVMSYSKPCHDGTRGRVGCLGGCRFGLSKLKNNHTKRAKIPV